MKKQRKLVACILAAVMVFGTCLTVTGCGESGGSDESGDVTITVKVPQLALAPMCDEECANAAQFLQKAGDAFAEQYEGADVSFNVIEFDIAEGWEDAIDNCYGKDNATDLLFGGYLNISSYIYSGNVVPLDDIITDDMKADIEESNWLQSQAVSNGKTYMMPFMSYQNTVLYNTDLFKQAGLDKYIEKDKIANWTEEEWSEIFSALKESCPDGTYPAAMYAANNQGDTHIMTLLRSKGSSFFDKDGYVNVNTEEGIAGLQQIKDNYDKGYYPAHAESLEIANCTEMFTNGQLGIMYLNNAFDGDAVDFEEGYCNFPGNVATSFLSGFEVFDNGDADKIQICKDFLSYIYSSDDWMDYSAGAALPVSKKVAEKHADDLYMISEYSANDANVVDFCMNNPNWMGVRAAFYPHIAALLTGQETAAEAAAGIDKDCNAAIDEGYKAAENLHE